MDTLRIFILLLFIAVSSDGFSQVHSSGTYEYLISIPQQKEHIKELTSPKTGGRGCGTVGAALAKEYIVNAFEKYGLRQWRGSYTQDFNVYPSKNIRPGVPPLKGSNVAGFVPSSAGGSDYIIIGAHYDNIGTIDGKIFPGADDNASGVTVLLELAKVFAELGRKEKLTKNIVFVAFDANNMNNAGSKEFVSDLRMSPGRIICMLNLDQIGSNLSPPGTDSSYLLILGADKLKEWDREQLPLSNMLSENPLELDFTYYNSPSFYNIFYRLSDQHSFTEKGIPALLFTSGITTHTNKESDTIANICFPVLDKRIKLIYKFIYQLVKK